MKDWREGGEFKELQLARSRDPDSKEVGELEAFNSEMRERFGETTASEARELVRGLWEDVRANWARVRKLRSENRALLSDWIDFGPRYVPRVYLIAHNSKFDVRATLHDLPRNICPGKVINNGSKTCHFGATLDLDSDACIPLMKESCKSVELNFRDSLSHLAGSLSGLGRSFGVPVEKEAIDYEFYTLERCGPEGEKVTLSDAIQEYEESPRAGGASPRELHLPLTPRHP